MKKTFVLLMLISLAMICSCQKQDSAAERQLAQRKAEQDAREKALDEREKALAEKEKATTNIPNIRPIPPDLQSRGQVRDPAQVKAERDRRLQQLSPDVQKLIPDPSQVQAERDRRLQGQRQRALEEHRMKIDEAKRGNKNAMSAAEQLQRMKSDAAKRAALSAPAASPAADATSPSSSAASPAAEATSPSPSPTPQ